MIKNEQWLLQEKYGGIPTPEYETDRGRLLTNEPLAYVIGSQPFLGLKICLDSRPLIPRVETEWWVEQMLEDTQNGARQAAGIATESGSVDEWRIHVLDLCSGSGAIGCAALARLPRTHVSFGEIDPAHKLTILKNIRGNGLDESRADIRIGDLFEPFPDMRFDLIAINPPYVPSRRSLDASVADYEPALALYAGADGLDVIRRIAVELPYHLAEGGVAWIEVDSEHASSARALFATQGLRAELRTDQYGQFRFIVVSFPHARTPLHGFV